MSPILSVPFSADSVVVLTAFMAAYLAGSIPWAYIIVRTATGEDITEHGSGNIGAMNVRRSTGSWGWFTVAMFADASKGIIPVALVWILAPSTLAAEAAVLGAVLGHNYSLWMALFTRHFARTGKGLATGGGALLAYDWRYFVAVLAVGLAFIALTRYMMAGQVAASFTLPLIAAALGSRDWPFALLMGAVVYAAHHKRFMGLLKGREPKLYIDDKGGPRG